MENINKRFAASNAAQTEVDVSDQMEGPFDLRNGADPIASAVHYDGTSAATLSSVGQVSAASDVSAGQIGITDAYTVVPGDATDQPHTLDVSYEEAGYTERPQ
jgi:hypothetical protein